MAEEFLEPIYKEAKILCALRQVVEFLKVHDEHHAKSHYDAVIPELLELCQTYMEYDQGKAMELYHAAQNVSNQASVVCVGDKIEYELIPRIEECMKRWGRIETENEEGDYGFETTVSGFLTIKDNIQNTYFHSTVDPMWEARKQAEYMYDPKKTSYSVLGCGLGYFIYQLYLVSEKSIVIHVYERDARMIEYAKNYGVLDWIPEENLNVVVCDDSFDFLKSAEDDDIGFHILPFALNREPEDMKAVLTDLYIQFSTGKKFERCTEINFYRNIKSDCKNVSEADLSKLHKEFIVVGAGPSLDDSMEFLRENKGKKTIVAVGTVFKKLLAEQIEPDFVVVVDPQERTFKQIEGAEENQVPMLVGMTAYWKFAAAYQGPKYLIALGESNVMIQYALENEMELWSCKGTVTSLAMEAAIHFGAKEVYFVGVDLAYPASGASHAKGTMDCKVANVEKMQQVVGVHDQIVYSTVVFNSYRKGIEDRIQDTPQITYYNMSNCGSRIAGTIELSE